MRDHQVSGQNPMSASGCGAAIVALLSPQVCISGCCSNVPECLLLIYECKNVARDMPILCHCCCFMRRPLLSHEAFTVGDNLLRINVRIIIVPGLLGFKMSTLTGLRRPACRVFTVIPAHKELPCCNFISVL